jgi:hypothetical protein
MSQVQLDDGSLWAPTALVSGLIEELEARGSLTVSEAQCLVEKWSAPKKGKR